MRSRSTSIVSGNNYLSVVPKYKSTPFAGSDISCRRRRTCRRDLFRWTALRGPAGANINLLAIFRIRGSWFCISNISAAVIAGRFALRLAAYIRFISRQAAAIGWCAVIMLRRATNVVTSPNLRRHDQTETRLFSRVLPIADLRVSSIASSALRSMHPIGVRQHVPAHQSKYDEHNHGGHDPHHTHFGFIIVSFILVRHLSLLNLSSTVTPQHTIAGV